MIFIYVYLHFIYLLYFDIFIMILLNFALLTGYALRPVLLSNTVQTESFTPYNNINVFIYCLVMKYKRYTDLKLI